MEWLSFKKRLYHQIVLINNFNIKLHQSFHLGILLSYCISSQTSKFILVRTRCILIRTCNTLQLMTPIPSSRSMVVLSLAPICWRLTFSTISCDRKLWELPTLIRTINGSSLICLTNLTSLGLYCTSPLSTIIENVNENTCSLVMLRSSHFWPTASTSCITILAIDWKDVNFLRQSNDWCPFWWRLKRKPLVYAPLVPYLKDASNGLMYL